MAQHDFVLNNGSGAAFRADLNEALQAIMSQSSGAIDPADALNPETAGIVAAYQLWVDTAGANPLLKIRNAANSAWILVGRADLASFGSLYLAATTLQTMAGPLAFSNTDYIKLPVGTTAQRPGSGLVDGMIRYNTDLTTFEGYRSSAWAPIGGGGFTVLANATLAAAGALTVSSTDQRQLVKVQGTGGPTVISTTPFGAGGGWKDGTEVMLIGLSDANSVILTFNDATNGLVGNFETLELGLYQVAVCVWSTGLGRWILNKGA